ncbi:MAG: cyclopropane fatty acyl phospholipid synthase [Deltaproteobacteria bacterium]|uniref:cyclopropane fatty acyl phospholipid synthase n=1 Tax=Desulfobacula sp. TaxID=2593537 RepID=UPI0019B658F2|nr:cyclopropane fatty acyl phospholipid synthase [Candidatus Desulfobacula maris]MBL6994124.1 cyclopropane fatty acyl phospholipid synthase [Desulfobacula sp.]
MNNKEVKKAFSSLMQFAGITVNGKKSYDIQVYNDQFYSRVLEQTTLGLGESYMDKWWDCRALDQFIEKVTRANLLSRLKTDWATAWNIIKSRILNLQTTGRAFIVGKKHYDIGNDLYQRMLDRRMQYTCGYWDNADSLDTAQEAKLQMICRKMDLKPGMTIAELGCGFGGFAQYAAKKHGVRVVGYTVSREQALFAKQWCRGLPVDIRLEDYRKAVGQYDRVVSIGLMEHVGYKNYRTYMKMTSRLLKEDGIAFIHTIGSNISRSICNPWTSKYIFPNSMLPSIAQLGKSMEGYFVVEDWHNFGEDYDKTLMAWWKNFENAWPELESKYGDRFYRMWKYYLLSCAGGFRSRLMQLWQVVMTKPGRTRPDCRIR